MASAFFSVWIDLDFGCYAVEGQSLCQSGDRWLRVAVNINEIMGYAQWGRGFIRVNSEDFNGYEK
jgi:hypothetical protein